MTKSEKELQEQKKKIGEYNKELKVFSDEELDEVAGGFLTPVCPQNCQVDFRSSQCYCPKDMAGSPG